MSQSLDSLIALLTQKLSSITDTSTNGEDLLLISKAISQINEVQNSEARYQSLADRLTALEGTVGTNNDTINALVTENDSKINSLTLALNEHKANINNPNNVTKNQVGLNLVDNFTNTFDINDSSTDKYALAKGVNELHNKIKTSESNILSNTNKIQVLENYHNTYPTPWEKISTGSPLKFGVDIGSDEPVARWSDPYTIQIYGILRTHNTIIDNHTLLLIRKNDFIFATNFLLCIGHYTQAKIRPIYLHTTENGIRYHTGYEGNMDNGCWIMVVGSIPVMR